MPSTRSSRPSASDGAWSRNRAGHDAAGYSIPPSSRGAQRRGDPAGSLDCRAPSGLAMTVEGAWQGSRLEMHDRISFDSLCFPTASLQQVKGYWHELGARRVSILAMQLTAETVGEVKDILGSGPFKLE